MKLYRLLANSLCPVFSLLFSFGNAQPSLQDSSMYNQPLDNIIHLYKAELGGSLRIYNGSEYQYAGHNIQGFPYFESPGMLNGSVYYDGNFYSDMQMYYDLVNDQLVIPDYTKNYPLKLLTDKVKYFTIGGHRFVNLNIADNLAFSSSPGYYEELYHNKTAVFAKRKKQVQVKTSAEGSQSSYRQFNWYFINKNGKIYEATGENSVLDVFKEKRNELKKFIRANNISFKKNFEYALVQTTRYYDEIEN